MNILFVSQSALDKKKSFGNTICNWFEGNEWKGVGFSHFYARKQKPDNNMSVNYYNLPATEIVRGIFKLNIKGLTFNSGNCKVLDERKEAFENEKNQIDKLHDGKNHNIIYFFHELVWMSKLWINKSLKNFINKNSPDIIFTFATSPYIIWPLIKYLRKHTNCKVVLFIADNVYESYDDFVWYRKLYLKKYFAKCIKHADKLYAVSNEMAQLYKKLFKKDVSILYKGCDLSVAPKNSNNSPLRMVYAGNLLWGRDETLAKIVKALKIINSDSLKIVLEIYTGTAISDTLKSKLNVKGISRVLSAKPYEEIKKIINSADISLHVESFDREQIKLVKQSFSTKIIDCLQSGTQVIGIGPKKIASVEYLRKIDGVLVIDELNDITQKLSELIKDTDKIMINKKKIFEYAKKKHDINIVQKELKKELYNLL